MTFLVSCEVSRKIKRTRDRGRGKVSHQLAVIKAKIQSWFIFDKHDNIIKNYNFWLVDQLESECLQIARGIKSTHLELVKKVCNPTTFTFIEE